MNRKLLFGLLVLLFSSMSIGLTSCKDDLDDIKKEQGLQNADLNKKIEDLGNALRNEIAAAQAACKTACEAERALLKSYLEQLIAAETAKAEADNEALRRQLQSQIDDLVGRITRAEGRIATLETTATRIEDWIRDNEPRIAALEGKLDGIEGTVKDYVESYVTAQIAIVNAQITNLQQTLQSQITDIKEELDKKADAEDVADLAERVEVLEGFALQTQETIGTITLLLNTAMADATQALADAAAANEWIEANKDRLDTLEEELAKLKSCNCPELLERVETLEADVETLRTDLTELSDALDAAVLRIDDAEGRLDMAEADIENILRFFGLTKEDLEAEDVTMYDYKALVATVQQHTADIEELKDKTAEIFSYLNEVLDELITSLIVQNVFNNVFGTLATPFGVNSNILMTFYGWNTVTTNPQFPTNFTEAEYNSPEDYEDMFTDEALAALNPQVYNVPEGYLLNGTGNMGKLYLTINPSNVDFTKQNVALSVVNSQGVEAPVTVGPLAISDQVLYFGYTYSRAPQTYFYEAPVTISEQGISELKLGLPDISKSDIKDVIKNRGISDIASLALKVYKTYNNALQAYALQTTNTVSASTDGNIAAKERTVTSQYNFAATCVKPLSFHALLDAGIKRDVLPTISPLSEYLDKLIGKINLEIRDKTFSIGDYTFKFGEATRIEIGPDDIETIVIDGIEIYDENGNPTGTYTGPIEITGGNLKPLLKVLNEALGKAYDNVDELIDNIDEQLKDFIAHVSQKIDEYLDEFVADINDQIQGIKDDIKGDLNGAFGRLDDFVNLYNRFAARVNNLFHNPNHYLQVTTVFKGNDGAFHQLSNSKRYPSKFRKGAGNAIQMYLTTYSAELVAPAFKKYVAITGKYDAETREAVDCDLASLNADNLNTVLEGRQKRFAFPTDQLEAGYIYEITYQALDYHGYTSTRKMYLEIVK